MSNFDRVVTGTIAALGEEVQIALDSAATLGIQIVGDGSASVTFQGSNDDGVNWEDVYAISKTSASVAGTGGFGPKAKDQGLYFASVAGLGLFRVVANSDYAWVATYTITIRVGQSSVMAMIPTPTVFDSLSNTQLTTKVFNVSASGNTTLIFSVSGQRIRVFSLIMTVMPSDIVRLRRYNGIAYFDLLGPLSLGNLALDFTGEPWFETTVDEDLVLLVTSANVIASGVILYTSVSGGFLP